MNLQQEIEAEKLRSSLESAQFGIASVQLEGFNIPEEWRCRLIERARRDDFDTEALVKEVIKAG
jgi:hypothetical protein